MERAEAARHLGREVALSRRQAYRYLQEAAGLSDPVIQQELDRRLAAAQAADPQRTRTQAVERDLARVGKTIERLLTAYQEDSVSLDQLRERMPLLRQREQTLRQELNALVEQTRDRAAHLRLAETLSAFLTRLRASAETLDIVERQRIVRLLVKEVLVSDDTLVISPLYSRSLGTAANGFRTQWPSRRPRRPPKLPFAFRG